MEPGVAVCVRVSNHSSTERKKKTYSSTWRRRLETRERLGRCTQKVAAHRTTTVDIVNSREQKRLGQSKARHPPNRTRSLANPQHIIFIINPRASSLLSTIM